MINNQPVHWFDGYDTTTVSFSGNNVTAWQDKSGNGRNCVSAGLMNITYDGVERGLKFNGAPGAPGYLAIRDSTSLFKGTPYTIFIVEKKNATTDFMIMYGMYSTTATNNQILHVGYRLNNQVTYDQYFNGYNHTDNSLTSFTKRLWVYRQQSSGATSRSIRLNGALLSSDTNTTLIGGSTPVSIGFYQAPNGSAYYNGTIYEIVAYHGDLTDSQVQQMEGYLAWKWDLKSALPNTHPYFFTNPNAQIISTRPVLWHDGFDQTTLTYSGANVTGWADKSGNNRNSTTATSVITYSSSERGLVFNGTNSASGALVTANSGTTFKNNQYTIFLVEKKNTASLTYVCGSDAGADDPTNKVVLVFYPTDTSFRSATFGSSVQYDSAGLSGSVKRMWTITQTSSGTRTLRLNGITVASNATNAVTGTYPFMVGGFRSSSSYTANYNGIIYEVVGYHGDLTTAQVQQNEGYLAWKWGLQASLPSTHPYFSVNSNVFNPVILFRPVHWFDAYFSTNMTFSSGSNISTWIDRSSSGLNATKQGGSAIVGYDAADRGVYFADGTNGYLLSSNTSNLYKNTPFTIFAVEKKVGETTRYFYNNVSTLQTNTTLVLGYNGSNSRFVQYNNDINYFNTVNTGSVKRLTTYQTPEGPLSSFMRQNGALVGTRPNNTLMVGDGGNIAVGFHFSGDAYIGTIYEIVGYHSSLSPQQIQLIEGSLAWKWGLQGDLDAAHPYKNVNPNSLTPSIVVRPDAENSTVSYFWSLSNAPVAVSSYNLVITDNASFSNTIPLTSGTGSYTLTGLTNGVPYSGFISANNELLSTGPAATFRTVTPGTAPSAPQSVQITPIGSNRISLRWTPPITDGGANIKWYTIKNSTNTVRFPARGYQTELLTPMISTGRQQFSVQAVNDATYGDFGWSPIFSIPFGSFIPNIYFPLDGSLEEFYRNYTVTASGSPLPGYSTSTVLGSQALVLNASAGQFLTLNNPNMNWSAFTFSGWVNPISAAVFSRIFDFGTNSDTFMALASYVTTTSQMQFRIAKGIDTQDIVGSVPLQSSIWTHLAVTLDGSMGRLYRNGIMIGNSAITFKPSDVFGNNNFIGRPQSGTNPLFNGVIDDFAFISTALDASTIALIHDSGTLLGSNVLSLSTVSTVITGGLTFWVDPLSKTSYTGGATMYNQSSNNLNGVLAGSYAIVQGEGLRLSNITSNWATNVSYLQAGGTMSNIRTISAWYKTLSTPTFAYFVDARTTAAGGNIQMYPWSYGSNFNNAIVYVDGDNMRRIDNCSNAFSAAGNWRNMTVVAPANMTDDIHFFAGFASNNGLDCVFGPVQVYDRVLTRDENIQNYNRYRGRYGLASVVQDGLIFRTDPVDLLSWSTGMTVMNNMTSNGVNGTLFGTYSEIAEYGIRFTNSNASGFNNFSLMQAGTLNDIRTISIWYNIVSIPVAGYIFDARQGLTNGWIYVNSDRSLNIGTAWSDALVYVNGDQDSMTPFQATSSISVLSTWKNITFVLNSSRPSFTDNLTFFGLNGGSPAYDGLNAIMGPIFVYNRAITAAENTENFNRYKYRYGLYPVTNGLVYHADPLNSASYTSGTELRNLASGSSVVGALSGPYSKVNYEGIQLTNTTPIVSDFSVNNAGLTLSSTTYRTFVLWYKVNSAVSSYKYLIDGRSGIIIPNGSYLIESQTGVIGIGDFFTNATVYLNGGAGQTINTTIVTAMFAPGGWRNYTIVAIANPSGPASSLDIFTENGTQGLNCTFGPIMIYDRPISQAENLQNFNTYRVRYGL